MQGFVQSLPTCWQSDNIPVLELFHMQEPVAVLSRKLKLGRQREHGFIEVSQHSFDGGGVLVAVVNVIIQTDELPVGEKDVTFFSCFIHIKCKQNPL